MTLTIPQLKKLQRENTRDFIEGLDAYLGEALKPDASEAIILPALLLLSWCEMEGEILSDKIAARRRVKRNKRT
jgi:hypothetical protein